MSTIAGTARIRLAITVYGVMGIVAFLAAAWGGRPLLILHPEPWLDLRFPLSTGAGVAAGILVAATMVLATRLLVGRVDWATRLHRQFRAVLGSVTRNEAMVFAATSGIGEELLFRGALQPMLGIVGSSVLFGAVHVMTPFRSYWPWTAWATLMGFVFAGMFAASGDLAGPIVCHAAINFVNLRYIDRRPDGDRDAGAKVAPAEITRRPQ